MRKIFHSKPRHTTWRLARRKSRSVVPVWATGTTRYPVNNSHGIAESDIRQKTTPFPLHPLHINACTLLCGSLNSFNLEPFYVFSIPSLTPPSTFLKSFPSFSLSLSSHFPHYTLFFLSTFLLLTIVHILYHHIS